MVDQVQTFEFSAHSDSEKTMVEPSPAYTSITKVAKQDKKEKKDAKEPSSVFTLRTNSDGEVELTSNRKIIRLTIEHKFNNNHSGASDRWSSDTLIKADVIPTNSDVLKQVVQDVHNQETQSVLHAPHVFDKDKKARKTSGSAVEASKKSHSWWPFKNRSKA